MSAIRSTGGKAEVALRSLLHRRGLRFRKNDPRLVGKPDIVFPRARVTVFVDGDYWHARVLREKGPAALQRRLKTPNRAYWIAKFGRRMQRDDDVTATLQAAGWIVVRMWESDVRRDPQQAANEVEAVVRRRTEGEAAPKRRPQTG